MFPSPSLPFFFLIFRPMPQHLLTPNPQTQHGPNESQTNQTNPGGAQTVLGVNFQIGIPQNTPVPVPVTQPTVIVPQNVPQSINSQPIPGILSSNEIPVISQPVLVIPQPVLIIPQNSLNPQTPTPSLIQAPAPHPSVPPFKVNQNGPLPMPVQEGTPAATVNLTQTKTRTNSKTRGGNSKKNIRIGSPPKPGIPHVAVIAPPQTILQPSAISQTSQLEENVIQVVQTPNSQNSQNQNPTLLVPVLPVVVIPVTPQEISLTPKEENKPPSILVQEIPSNKLPEITQILEEPKLQIVQSPPVSTV